MTDKAPEQKIIEKNTTQEVTCNAYRMDISEKHLLIEFGQARNLENGNQEVIVISKIVFPVKNMYLGFLTDLIKQGLKYEKDFSVSLFPKDDNSPEEEQSNV